MSLRSDYEDACDRLNAHVAKCGTCSSAKAFCDTGDLLERAADRLADQLAQQANPDQMDLFSGGRP